MDRFTHCSICRSKTIFYVALKINGDNTLEDKNYCIPCAYNYIDTLKEDNDSFVFVPLSVIMNQNLNMHTIRDLATKEIGQNWQAITEIKKLYL